MKHSATAPWVLFILGIATASPAFPIDYHVAPGGDNGDDGSFGAPWATLQHAADQISAGDNVIVQPGLYIGFDFRTSGTANDWIEFIAEPGVIIDRPNSVTGDGVNIEDASFIRVEGFTVQGAPGTIRNGFRAALGAHIQFINNRSFDNAERGFFTGFVDDVLLEGNEAAGSIDEHGIYVSNSGDRPVIRDNYLYENNGAGVHMNGDESLGGDGIISHALVERNRIIDNGLGGGAGINSDGVQDSIIRNNLIIGNHATGITLFQQDGGGPSVRNQVIFNTVVNDSDGRWGITIRDGAIDNRVLNNIFISRHGFRGALDIHNDSQAGLQSDYNILEDRVTTDGGDSVVWTLAQWQSATGQDLNSLVASESALFANPQLPAGDYHLRSDSPARDSGLPMIWPQDDFEGGYRPSGAGVDRGADEFDLCTGSGELQLNNSVETSVVEHDACRILAGPSWQVASGGDVTLSALDRVLLQPGVSVVIGGTLRVKLESAH